MMSSTSLVHPDVRAVSVFGLIGRGLLELLLTVLPLLIELDLVLDMIVLILDCPQTNLVQVLLLL